MLNPSPPQRREDTGSEKQRGQPKVTQLGSGRGLNRVSLACPHHATWCGQQGARGLGQTSSACGKGPWPLVCLARGQGRLLGDQQRDPHAGHARVDSSAHRQPLPRKHPL